MMRRLSAGLLLVAGCGWFDDGRDCEPGTLSCDGDKVRLCVARSDGTIGGSSGGATSWQVVQTCEDDPVLGSRTCGVRGTTAQCILEGTDGAVVDGPGLQESEWRRVDVVLEDGSLRIEGASSHFLQSAPLAASFGVAAAVSYADAEPLDAALIPWGADANRASVWLRSSGASRVAIVDEQGQTLSELELDETPPSHGKVRVANQALGLGLPPTLRVREPAKDLQLPLAWQATMRLAAPTPELLNLVGEALGQIPLAGSSSITEVAFAEQPPAKEADGGVGDAQVAGNVAGPDASDAGGLALDAAAGADAGQLDGGPATDAQPLPARTLLVGTSLWINGSAELMRRYAMDENERLSITVEIARRAGEAYAAIASTPPKRSPSARPLLETKTAIQYPEPLASLIQSRITPLLAKGESFATAWAALHQVGVDGRFAGRYGAEGWLSRDEKQAVAEGFASVRGGESPAADFAEYFALANIEGAWSWGPCESIRGVALDRLPAPSLVPLTKLEVLLALGVLDRAKP